MDHKEGRTYGACGAVILPDEAAWRLRSAFEQMDLLLETQQVDVGLDHLLELLRSLQAVRRLVT